MMIPSCTFDEWKRNNGVLTASGLYETSWPQQLALAKNLFDEAYGSHPGFVPDDASPEDVIRDIQTAEYDADKIVSWKGIGADWLLDVFCQTPYIQRLIEFDCDCWFVRDVCFIEFLRRNGKQGALVDHVTMFDDDLCVESLPKRQHTTSPANLSIRFSKSAVAEKADVFVSYTGRYKFRFFVESLGGLRGKPVWMDLFCVDQFAWSGGKGTHIVDNCRNGLLDGLCSSIREIGSVVLLLERWDGVVDTVGQSWVFWEMFNAVRANAGIRLALTSGERTRLLASLDSVEAKVLSQLMAMDMDRLKAANLQDKEAILGRLHDGETSLRDVSCKICDCVRDLFCNEVVSHAQVFLSDIPEDHHPNALTSINRMAEFLLAQGKLEESAPLFRETLNSRRLVLGTDSPDTLISINNLASCLLAQGKLEEAETLYQEALNDSRRILGDNHPDKLTFINNMATCLSMQGKLKEAEQLYQESLNSRRSILGNDHPDTMSSISNMASCLQEQGKLDEAAPLFREALDKRRRILKDDHPDTLKSIGNMASFLYLQDKLEEAAPFYQEALNSGRRILGNDHPNTLKSISNMASFLQAKGKLEEAELLYQEALNSRRRLLGDDHPDTLTSMNNMASCLHAQDKLEEAESFLQ